LKEIKIANELGIPVFKTTAELLEWDEKTMTYPRYKCLCGCEGGPLINKEGA